MSDPAKSPIDRLFALQEIDRRLRDKSELVESLERELADLDTEIVRQRERTRMAQEEREADEARRRQIEAHIAGEEEKLKDRRMRLNRVRNERELQSLRREIELGKETTQQAEEELLGVFESLEVKTAAAREAESSLRELEQSAASQMTERQTRVSQLRGELDGERAARTQVAATLDRGLRVKYEQIFERRGGTAVVEVRNGTCLGCHMNLPPQFFNELQRARDVRLCPSCHRILFWRPERLDQADIPR
ncbi:MAG: C4-type zinc ribbon domain-containing protein [Candidatus Binatia bacterium]